MRVSVEACSTFSAMECSITTLTVPVRGEDEIDLAMIDFFRVSSSYPKRVLITESS